MNMFKGYFLVLFVLVAISCSFVEADEKTHRYVEGEPVNLWVNKVGPFRNPQETYMYYTLPFCKPDKKIESKFEGLGEALTGYELIKSKIEFKFKIPEKKTEICESKALTKVELKKFTRAVKNQYVFEMFVDDLPIWEYVGGTSKSGEPMLYTHKSFVFTYNEDRIISIKVIMGDAIPLKSVGQEVTFTYSTEWAKTDNDFMHRFDEYLDNKLFEHQIHWFSIFNSFMMVIFLVGLVSVILMKTLKGDYLRNSPKDEEEGILDIAAETGWKKIRGDVFRAPVYLEIFSAILGTGAQILVITCLVVLLSMGFYHNHPMYRRGSVVTVMILCYAFTASVAGYVSGQYYARNGGKRWKFTMILTAMLFPGFVFGLAFLLNFVAIIYGSLASIPFTTMLIMVALWGFIAIPLTMGGTILGRNWAVGFKPPHRIGPFPKAIPEKYYYQQPLVHIVLGGILPFGSIFIEMYFVFTALWQYKYYYVFGFLILVYVILIAVTSCVCIVSTYFLLNAEDYRWQWTSFLTGSSTAGYVFLYSIYYYIANTSMTGVLQVSFFFGYIAMFCVGLALLVGAIGYISTHIFVNRIYSKIRKE
eukprot:TRINITY_DN10677_c0_g1_i1.p1 TRINITY_DN10677_c0_g1~~TRINITY_DN10677_c0_g1_i1.p1  ORF type:complete len:588 (-),score=102.86 TRINITY_DN10677_c0_g1_i1:32-1795(-)